MRFRFSTTSWPLFFFFLLSPAAILLLQSNQSRLRLLLILFFFLLALESHRLTPGLTPRPIAGLLYPLLVSSPLLFVARAQPSRFSAGRLSFPFTTALFQPCSGQRRASPFARNFFTFLLFLAKNIKNLDDKCNQQHQKAATFQLYILPGGPFKLIVQALSLRYHPPGHGGSEKPCPHLQSTTLSFLFSYTLTAAFGVPCGYIAQF